MNKRPFIIDCDTGTDDAIAIIAALYSKEIEIKALTAVNGNVPLTFTAENTLNLVDYLGFSYPVAAGAAKPLRVRGDYYDGCHGPTGMGNLQLPKAGRPLIPITASTLIHEIAVEEKGELELFVLGPMTNIAIALINYPETVSLIKHIYFMGGAIKGGNMTTTAEFNIWVDPEAAKIVLASGIPLTMVGLDVTLEAALNKDDLHRIEAFSSKASKVTSDLLLYMFDRFQVGGEAALMHDALAIAAALCPKCLTLEPYFVDVECAGTYTAGHTMVDIKKNSGRPANVNVATALELAEFKEWLIGCVANSV